jgi:putative aldouronate transport system permease protein
VSTTGYNAKLLDLQAAHVRPETEKPATRRKTHRRPEPFTIASYIVVTLFGLFCLVPLWMIIAGSFTDETVLARQGYSLFPSPFSLTAYELLFNGQSLLNGYVASLFITLVGTMLSVSGTATLAWVIARRLPWISRPLTVFAYVPMLFHGGLVPLYLLVTQVLSLSNSWFAVILPILLAPFLVFITVSFFRQLPEEIIDAARIDGAGELRIFFQIILPLSKPILAVLGLFYAVTYWNEWFMALLFVSDPEKYPLQLILQNLIANVTNATSLPGATAAQAAAPVYQLRFAMTVLTVGPILCAYPFAQRFFVKGITLGATKG